MISTLDAEIDAPVPPAPPAADTLADNVVLMIILMAAQRLLGFVRGVLFCRWLDPAELGQWEMALAFFSMAAPLAVLGIPGSFGRYVEYYRAQGQLKAFLRRTAALTTVLVTIAVAVMYQFPAWVSWWVFGRDDQVTLVGMMVGTLGAVIAMNYLSDLFTALRRFRLVAVLQFLHSVAFAVLGIALAVGWQATALGLVAANSGASLLVVLVALWFLRKTWPALPVTGQVVAHRALWTRFLPFAVWIWITNVVWNLFVFVDRYMILHVSGLSEQDALELIGNYHSSRVVPTLLASIAATVATVVMPHLSHDWESGRKGAVSARTNLVLKLVAYGLTAGGVLILLASPLLFNVAFEGKFAAGEAVLPWTLVYCVWLGMTAIVHNYLWCAEKAGLGSLAMFAGLIVNVALNLLLVSRFGLRGAVLATAAANLAALSIVYLFGRRLGLRADRGAVIAIAMPMLLALGVWGALAAFAAITVLAVRSNQFLNADERASLLETAVAYRRKFKKLKDRGQALPT